MKALKIIISLLLIGGMLMFTLGGCFAAKYSVDYNGKKDSFSGAKDSYRAGEKVTLYYSIIATDTDYSFYLDDKRINPDYEESKGYIISFEMPAHDVSLKVDARNSMEYIPNNKTACLTFDSFDGGGPAYKVKIDDLSIVTYDQTKHYNSPNHNEMAGSGYTVKIEFFGLKAGKTTVTVECRSPIADNYDAVYEVEVDDSLAVTITKKETKEITP